MINLFDEQNNSTLKKLNYCAWFTFPIGVNDGFPPYICYRCSGLLEITYEFKKICEAADAKFLAMSRTIVKSEQERDNFNSQTIVKSEEISADVGGSSESSQSHLGENGYAITYLFDFWKFSLVQFIDPLTMAKVVSTVKDEALFWSVREWPA